MNTFKKSLIASAAAIAFCTPALAVTDADIEASFSPYKNGMPSFPGLEVGMVINQANADKFKEVLDPAAYQLLKDGWFEMKVGETLDFALAKGYVEATRKNAAGVKLGEKPGELIGYVAGRPFPAAPDTKDPRAGEKLAWNFKYGINWGESATIKPFYWQYRNAATGQVERNLTMEFHFLNFKHRTDVEPIPDILPNAANLYRANYIKVLEPQDLRNTQLLLQTYDDDAKQTDAYLYLGFQKRVRRLATGQTTDAFLGSDMMIEDFEGYNGRVSEMKWTFLGTQNILMPYFKHTEAKLTDQYQDPEGYKYVDFEGKGNCLPAITWQLRKVHVLQAEPLLPSHPVSKRLLYLDAQVMGASRSMVYDRKGELWKTLTVAKAHPDFHLPANKGSGIALDDAFSQIDVQAQHCTTAQFKGWIDVKGNPPSIFQVQHLRGGD